jgi:putative tricarboxylic transport membrane protein
MKAHDRRSSLFWLLLSIVVCVESVRLGVGTLISPGMGFLAFGASSLLAILSALLFVRASLQKGDIPGISLFKGKSWGTVIWVFLALASYSVLLPKLGYLLSTFVLLGFFFLLLERKRVLLAILSSLLVTLVTYLFFSKLLYCQFPDGILGL